MIFLEEERQRQYFVDNKFSKNKYNITTKLKYFCIKEREVSNKCIIENIAQNQSFVQKA